MSRMMRALTNDIRLQARYGLYGVTAIMVLIWGVGLGALARNTNLPGAVLLAPFLVVNLQVTTFFFMAALVLFEKSEGVLPALVVTPLRGGEYLASKTFTLTALAVIETLPIAAMLFDGPVSWPRAFVAALLLGILYSLAGFLTVVRFESINRFLLPASVVITISMAPLAAHFGAVPHRWMLLHPVEPALLLATGEGGPIALAAAAAWCIVAGWAARRAFTRFVVNA